MEGKTIRGWQMLFSKVLRGLKRYRYIGEKSNPNKPGAWKCKVSHINKKKV